MFLHIEFDKFSKNFISAGISIIIIVVLIHFVKSSTSEFSIEIFYISFNLFWDFFEFCAIFLIFLYYIVFFFIPDNFINSSSSSLVDTSLIRLKERSYSHLSLPSVPSSDKDFISINIAYSLSITFLTVIGINIIRSFLVAWYFFTDQYFYNHIDSLYLIYAFFICIFEILLFYYFIHSLLTRNRTRSQHEFNLFLAEKNKIYKDFENGQDLQPVSNPAEYLVSILTQYYNEHGTVSLIDFTKSAFYFSFITTFILFLTNKLTIQYLVLYFLCAFFVIFFSGLLINGSKIILRIIPVKMRSGVFRGMIDSTLNNDAYSLVSEVENIENNLMDRSTESKIDNNLFWYFKARVLMMAGYYSDASVILFALFNKLKNTLLLRSEVAFLLAQCYLKLSRSFDANELLTDVRNVFSENNIVLPEI